MVVYRKIYDRQYDHTKYLCTVICSCLRQRDQGTEILSGSIFYPLSDQCGHCRIRMAENVFECTAGDQPVAWHEV